MNKSSLKDAAKRFSDLLFGTMLKPFLSNEKRRKQFFSSLSAGFNRRTGDYLQFSLVPGRAEQLCLCAGLGVDVSGRAIVLQGPVVSENDFTLETVRLYKRTCPGATIIVSTWDDAPDDLCARLKSEGAHVVKSSLPPFTGVGNVNYQVVSTNAGLEKAKQLGAQRVLKTRADQRLSRINLLAYLDSLIDTFPVDGPFYSLGQKARLVFGQGTIGGTMFLPFYLCDWYMYGDIDDMVSFFAFPLQQFSVTRGERVRQAEALKGKCTVAEYHKALAPEMFLTLSYIERKCLEPVPETVGATWDFIKSNLITVGHRDVELFWLKYRGDEFENIRNAEYWPQLDGANRYWQYAWTFENWFCLHTGCLRYDPEMERISLLPASEI